MGALIKTIIRLLLLLLAIYSVLRIAFGLMYFDLMPHLERIWLKTLGYGAMMDISAIIYINFPLIIFIFFILPFISEKYKSTSTLFLFLIINIPFLALNIIDIFYFRYNHRRSTIDIFYTLPKALHSLGDLFFQYWWVVIVFLAGCTGLFFLAKRIISALTASFVFRNISYIAICACWTLIFAFAARGINNRPVSPSTALLHFQPALQPVVNNSTLNIVFSILKSSTALDKKKYFSTTEIDSIFPIIKKYQHSKEFNKKNIVLFVLESFSNEQLNKSPSNSFTPFFDSLKNRSTVATNCYQNGGESVKGIVSILASTPPFLDEPIFVSNYNTIQFNGIGTLLKKEGYSTNFFLGAEYDHFNFAKLCKMVGMEHYYSKEDFKTAGKDDGNWGIYDEYFFDFFSQVTDTIRQPFFNVLYNISSHPPFKIPENRRAQFSKGTPQENAISYVDFCFAELFNKIRTKEWFRNSIFVFISDHTLLLDPGISSGDDLERMNIPFLVHDPSDTAAATKIEITQQLDVVPTILDILHYPKPFFSFGNSIFQKGYKFSISIDNQIYKLIDSAGVTGFNENTNEIVYINQPNETKESLTEMDKPNSNFQTMKIKAILQQFNNSLIRNSFEPTVP